MQKSLLCQRWMQVRGQHGGVPAGSQLISPLWEDTEVFVEGNHLTIQTLAKSVGRTSVSVGTWKSTWESTRVRNPTAASYVGSSLFRAVTCCATWGLTPERGPFLAPSVAKVLVTKGTCCGTFKFTPGRGHICKVCKKTFSQSGQVVCHMRIHTDQKPFTCESWGGGVIPSSNLTRHMKSEESLFL